MALRHRFAQARGIAAEDGDARAGPGQGLCDGGADPSPAARHQSVAPGRFHEVCRSAILSFVGGHPNIEEPIFQA
jgi:hypothetical protein